MYRRQLECVKPHPMIQQDCAKKVGQFSEIHSYEIMLTDFLRENSVETCERLLLPGSQFESVSPPAFVTGYLIPRAVPVPKEHEHVLKRGNSFENRYGEFVVERRLTRFQYLAKRSTKDPKDKMTRYLVRLGPMKGTLLPCPSRASRFHFFAGEKDELFNRFFMPPLYSGIVEEPQQYPVHIYPMLDTLQDVQRKLKFQFSATTALYLSAITLQTIHDVHAHGYVLRDIRPQVFFVPHHEKLFHLPHLAIMDCCFRTSDPIDDADWAFTKFSADMPTRYIARDYYMHGMPRFINDIESWLYMTLNFFDPNFLPWLGYESNPDPKTERCIYEKKNRLILGGYRDRLGLLAGFVERVSRFIEMPCHWDRRWLDYGFLVGELKLLYTSLKLNVKGEVEWQPDPDSFGTIPNKLGLDSNKYRIFAKNCERPSDFDEEVEKKQ